MIVDPRRRFTAAWAASAVITDARTSVAISTVSAAAVAGTSATLTSRVGNFDDGRTSQ